MSGRAPPSLSGLGTGLAYFTAASAALLTTRFEGGVAYLWVAGAILAARLTTLPRRAWRRPLIATFVASTMSTALFGLGPLVAVPLAFVNLGEAVLIALALHREIGRAPALASLRWLAVFTLAVTLATVIASVPAGILVQIANGRPAGANAVAWFIGHGLGTIAFMPIALMVLLGEAQRIVALMTPADRGRLAGLVALVALIATLSFAQSRLPLLFLPIMPILLATFRGGKLAAGVSVIVLTLVGAIFTMRGIGPVAAATDTPGEHLQFLQAYLAATMLTVLPATAELERHRYLLTRLSESEARYRLLMDHTSDVVVAIDLAGKITFASPSVRQLGRGDADTLIGQPIDCLVHPDDRRRLTTNVGQLNSGAQRATVSEYRVVASDGEVRWWEAASRPTLDTDGRATGLVSFVRDVTRRKSAEARLALAAMTDPLTGLANRRAFFEALDRRLAKGSGCIALLDLDHFKQVNDRFGHDAGDEVLRRFAAIARSSVRDSDLLARIGGEEFAILLPESSGAQAQLVCDRLRVAIAEARVATPRGAAAVTVSGGVACYQAGDDRATLMRAADAALYSSKHTGRDRLTLAS